MSLVQVHENRIVVNSLDIAKHFNKAHKDVLKALRNLECSEDFAKRNFTPWSYSVNNRQQPCYLMTRDGFSFLVMGFTGKEAA